MADTTIPQPTLPPAGASQADVFRALSSGLGLDQETTDSFANAIAAAGTLRPRLTGNVQQDIQNDIIKTGGRNVSSIRDAYQTPLQNQGLQSTTHTSANEAEISDINLKKAKQSVQPFTFSADDLISATQQAMSDGKNPKEIAAYLKQNGLPNLLTSPTTANDLQATIRGLENLRTRDMQADAASGGAHAADIKEKYDTLEKSLDQTGAIAATDVSQKQYNQTLNNQYTQTKGLIQGIINQFGQAKGNTPLGTGEIKGHLADVSGQFFGKATQYEKARSATAAGLIGIFGGQGTGLRMTQAEINNLGQLLPSIYKTSAENAAGIRSLDAYLRGKFGPSYGLDKSILKQYNDSSLPPPSVSSAVAAQSALKGKYSPAQIQEYIKLKGLK